MTTKWRAQERTYEIDETLRTFTKIEILSWQDNQGIVREPWMSKARLENEFTTLNFISDHTSIPVPKPLRIHHRDGCLALTTELVEGVPFDELPPALRSTTYLDDYIRSFILPQLETLTSDRSGTIQGRVLPPRRVFDLHDGGCRWLPRKSRVPEYRLTHNDLAQHNILCDPDSGKVKAVIDWEFAGYYPSYFEAPFWLTPYAERVDDGDEVARLVKFLDGSL